MVNSDQFHTTHWSVVLTAKGDDLAAREALSTLCETYYQPILRYIERQAAGDSVWRYGGRDAQDLTHDFFTQLLEGKIFATVDREGARFRVYLLGTVRFFLSQIRIRESAQKRGGMPPQISLPDDSPAPADFDDAIFDRDWASTMVRRAINTLENLSDNATQNSVSVKPSNLIQKLLPWLTGEMNAETRRQLATELEMSDVAIKVALHRVRKKFREMIRMQIAETVVRESDVNAELDHLIRALRGNVTFLQK